MTNFLLTDSERIVRRLIPSPAFYVILILSIRISGKRTISKMNNYMWIFTVATGLIISAMIIIIDEVSWVEGIFSIITLLLINYVIELLILDSEKMINMFRLGHKSKKYVRNLVTKIVQKKRILESEVWALIRQDGYKSSGQLHTAIFKSDARLSIISKPKNDNACFSLCDDADHPDGLEEEFKNHK